MERPVFYWSRRCEHCNGVREAMQLLGKQDLFKSVCIEEVGRPGIPPQLRNVPALWDPATQRLFEGKAQVLEFLAKTGMNTRREVPGVGGAGTGADIDIDALGEPDGPEIGGLLNEPDVPLMSVATNMLTDKNPDDINRRLEEMKNDLGQYGARF